MTEIIVAAGLATPNCIIKRASLYTQLVGLEATNIPAWQTTATTLGRRTAISRSGTAFGDMPVRDAYGYNLRSEITSARRTLTGTPSQEVRGFSYDYAYDPIGNRVTSTEYDHEDNALVSSYTANALNQYTQATVPSYAGVRGTATNTATVTVNGNPAWRLEDYFYGGDEAGNAPAALMKELAITAVYNPPGTNDPDVVTSQTGRVFVAQTPEAFQYDSDGNLTQDGRFDYTWNGENRLIKAETRDDLPASVPRVKVEYAYDHQGRMVWKQISTNAVVVSTRTLLWDGYNIVREMITDNGSLITTNAYVWGLDVDGTLQGAGGVGGLLAVVRDGETYFPAYDANGNVSEYVTTNGAVVAHYDYSPFGELLVQSGPLASAFTHRFSTKPFCAATGFSEYQMRKYRPELGRWISRDPASDVFSILKCKNTDFAFLLNSPIHLVDKFGLASVYVEGCNKCDLLGFYYKPEKSEALKPLLGTVHGIDGIYFIDGNGDIKILKVPNHGNIRVECQDSSIRISYFWWFGLPIWVRGRLIELYKREPGWVPGIYPDGKNTDKPSGWPDYPV